MKNKNLININIGDRFNKLIVLDEAYKTNYDTLYLCKCDCGLKLDVPSFSLQNGEIKACEFCSKRALLKRDKDYTNTVFGNLTVLYEIDPVFSKTGMRHRQLKCVCCCGKQINVFLKNLKSNKKTCCGCQTQSNSRLKGIWKGILCRTDPLKCKNDYIKKTYIDRNINLCKDWYVFDNFKQWSLSNGYKDNLTIDRINNDKGYYPENCRWVTIRENCCNKRNNIRLPNGHSFCNLLYNLGIFTNSPEYNKYLKYYKQFGIIHDDLNKRITDKNLNINNLV